MKELTKLDSKATIDTNHPFISLITVVYNNVEGIEKTISSVLSQTYPFIEYIIIDGGSNDGTVDIIKKYEYRIAYWCSEPDKGIYDAMNKGINLATSDYIMFLNSGDDFIENDSLEKIVRANNGNYDIIYNNLNIIENQTKSYIKTYPSELSFEYFTFETIPHPASLIKKSLFQTVGLYDNSFKIVSDWKWYLMAIIRFKVQYKYSALVVANFYLDGISSQKENEKLIFAEKAEILKKEFNYHLVPLPQKKKSPFICFKKIIRCLYIPTIKMITFLF